MSEITINRGQAEKLVGKYGSPLFVTFEKKIEENIKRYRDNFGRFPGGFKLAYSVKTNQVVGLLRVFKKNNVMAEVCSGADILGATLAGFKGGEIIFAGLVKSDKDLETAVKRGFAVVNVESSREAERLQRIARRLKKKVNVGIRLSFPSPVVGLKSLLGFSYDRYGTSRLTGESYRTADLIMKSSYLNLVGLHCHTGSGQKSAENYLIGIDEMVKFMAYIRDKYDFMVRVLNLGGGFGVGKITTYQVTDFGKQVMARLWGRPIEFRHRPMRFEEMAKKILVHLEKRLKEHDLDCPMLMLEPGASLVGDSTHLIARIVEVKLTERRRWMVIDAGTNLLPVLTLYSEYHDIEILTNNRRKVKVSVAGPLLYSADVVASDRLLPMGKVGELVVIYNVGAYFNCQANQFLYPRAASVLVAGRGERLIQRRETVEDIFQRDITE